MLRPNYTYIAITAFFILPSFILLGAAQQETHAQAATNAVSSISEGAINKIAPGEFLPISVKLVNFGSLKRVDVSITYQIFDSTNAEVYRENETVAVETTASFIKRIPLPPNLDPGVYTALSSIRYIDQEQPAESRFQFTVEKKIGSFFVSDLIFYAIVFFMTAVIISVLTYFFTRRTAQRMVLHDYSDKPRAERIYYEILSDIIGQMRLRIGDDALEITENIPNVEIDHDNGRVIRIGDDPAKIVALLIHRYETLLGTRISFGLRGSSNQNTRKPA